MPARLVRFRWLSITLASTLLVVVAATPAPAQFRLFHRTAPDYCPPPPCPPATVPSPAPAPSAVPPSETKRPEKEPAPVPAAPEPTFPSGMAAATGLSTVALAIPSIKGDQVPITAIAFAPPQNPLGQPRGSILAPPSRSYKMADDNSPQPRDRVFLDFNFYDNVGAGVARRLGIDLHGVDIYRENFGFEKTFFDNSASIGLRLPLNTLSSESNTAGMGGTDTDIGDLTTIFKYAFWQDPESGTLLSGGVAITVPTGPGHFAGSSIPTQHVTVLQPFFGFLWTRDNWFVHGFTAVDAPTDAKDVTSLFNSIGVGYLFTLPCADERFLRSIAPTFEVHVADPLNHRGAFKLLDPVGTADVVDLTLATTFGLGRRSSLSVGVVTPVTGPKPFDIEALVQFNWSFGARGCRSVARSPSLIGD